MKAKLYRALENIFTVIFFVSLIAIGIINYVVMYKEIHMITDLAFFPHWSMLIPLGTGAASFGGWLLLVLKVKPEK